MKNEQKLESLLRKDDCFRTLKLINVNVFAIHQLKFSATSSHRREQ